MDQLEVPDAPAGARIQADQALPEEPVAGPLAAVIVVGGGAEGQVDEAQRLVRAHQRPDVGAARRLPGTLLPRLVAELSFPGDGAEEPPLLAGADVEASHLAGRHDLREGDVVDLRSHHHDVADDHGRGGDAVETPRDGTAQPLRQVDAPPLAEGGDGLARLRVEADQVAVAGADQDASVFPVRPVGDAPVHEAVIGGSPVLPRPRVVDPPGLARRRVDGRDLGERGADIQDAADHERRGLPDPGRQAWVCP